MAARKNFSGSRLENCMVVPFTYLCPSRFTENCQL
jgi:hypothetical protein